MRKAGAQASQAEGRGTVGTECSVRAQGTERATGEWAHMGAHQARLRGLSCVWAPTERRVGSGTGLGDSLVQPASSFPRAWVLYRDQAVQYLRLMKQIHLKIRKKCGLIAICGQ